MSVSKPNPVVFIHGLWIHASSWRPWEEFFGDAGYSTLAPGWPGDGDTVELTRANPDAVGDKGIDDVADHFAAIIDGLPAPPIMIGHSFGGMIAQKLLGQGRGAAAVAIDAAQIKGVWAAPLSALRSALPVFKNPANKHRAVTLPSEQFRFSFGNAVSERSPTSSTTSGPSPRPASPSSRRRSPTSRPIRPTKSTRATRTEGRSCSSWVARTTPRPRRSPSR